MKKAFIITLTLVGILLVLQIRSFRNVEALIQRSGPENFINVLQTFQLANQQLRQQIKNGEENLADIKSKIAGQTVQKEIEKLKLLAGETEVYGEGIVITIKSPIKSFWILDIIAQLVSAGAEAIAINDIRLTPSTAGIRDIGAGDNAGLLMRRNFWRPPYRISIIGSTKDLKESVAQNNGIIDRIEKSVPNVSIEVTPVTYIVIPALAD